MKSTQEWSRARLASYPARIISSSARIVFAGNFDSEDCLNYSDIGVFISRQFEKSVIQYNLVCSFARLWVAFFLSYRGALVDRDSTPLAI